VTRERERLRQTLSAKGISPEAPVAHSLGPPRGRLVAAEELESGFVQGEQLGRGGMATVWAASQRALGREVAIKRADPADGEAERLLVREAIVAGQLEHPNIVPIHQLLVDTNGPAVVMKRISGKSWDALIEDPSVALDRHLDVFLQALNAVSFAHSRGVIHRDIKPQNIMIGSYGEVYLLDWGVAKRRQDPPSDEIVGTPCYMAPEMAEGLADERTDIFLLGATLHEVLVGTPRHEGETALDVLYAAMYVEPFDYPASVPAELAELCNRACARAPEARFQDVDALRAAVMRYREHRAAGLLTEDARALLERLQLASAARGEDGPGYDDVQLLHADTRRAFEAALRIWPESPSAREGLTSCLQLMFDYELERRQLLAAEALLAMLPSADEARRGRLELLRAEIAREEARRAISERDRDPNVGALGRTRTYLGIGLATALMTLALFARRLLLTDPNPSTLRLTVVGAVVLGIVGVGTLLWHRYGTFNLINRRIAEISLGTLAVSLASRLSGYCTDAPAERVLTSDAFILALGGLALTPYHRAGPWLAGLSLAVAAVGSWLPQLIDELFIVPSIVIPTTMLFLKRAQFRAPHAATPAAPAGLRET
jgi:hypothetical protein